MNISCDVIKDLLPLYAEGMTSGDTNALVEEHLENCEECRKKRDEYKINITIPAQTQSDHLSKIRKKLHIGVLWLVLRNCVLVAAVVFWAIILLTRPRVMSAEEADITVIENEEGVFIDFGEDVDTWRMRAGVNESGDSIEYIALTAFDWILDLSFLHSNYPEKDICYFDSEISNVPDYYYMEIGSNSDNVPIIRGEAYLDRSPYGSPFFRNVFLISLGLSVLFALLAWICRKRKLTRWLSAVAVYFLVLAVCTLTVTGNNWLIYEVVNISEYSIMIFALTGITCFGLICCREVNKYRKQGVLL